jgi:hypothetical protein
LLLGPSRSTMAKQLSNYMVPWSCARPPERSAGESSLGTRRMHARLGELHQPLHLHPTRNPGGAWSVHALTGLVS